MSVAPSSFPPEPRAIAVTQVDGSSHSESFFMEQHIEVEGRILTVLAGTMFRVELPNKHQVLATISGKMRKRFVRLTIGDRVKMEMSPYDLTKARIVWRLG
jgi:translation initiation factor IF-1